MLFSHYLYWNGLNKFTLCFLKACKNGAYHCASMNTCIPSNKLCDGTADCVADHGDENSCDCKLIAYHLKK